MLVDAPDTGGQCCGVETSTKEEDKMKYLKLKSTGVVCLLVVLAVLIVSCGRPQPMQMQTPESMEAAEGEPAEEPTEEPA
jgi:hypothetical protein